MKLLTLCSGIGSPELGFQKVYGKKLSIVGACEIDKFARQTYQANFKISDENFHHDVTKLYAETYQGIDALIGGFPCQAFSIAGKRLGFEDTRGTLFFDFVRILKESKPRFFIFENVKGLVGHDKEKDKKVYGKNLFKEEVVVKTIKYQKIYSQKHPTKEIGRTMATIENVLDETGYHWSWEVLNSKDYGVPQNRERVFMIGFRDEKDFKNFSFPKPLDSKPTIADILEDEVDEKYYLKPKNLKGLTLHKPTRSDIKTIGHSGTGGQKRTIVATDGISSCLSATDHKQPKQIIISATIAKEAGFGSEQNRRVLDTDGVSSCLTTMGGGHQEPKILQRGRGFNKGGEKAQDDGIYPTLGCSSWEDSNHLLRGARVRKLTPRECFRLQGFPDSFKFVVSNSQLYKQAGNTITVTVMEEVAKEIKKAFEPKEMEEKGLFKLC